MTIAFLSKIIREIKQKEEINSFTIAFLSKIIRDKTKRGN